MEEGISVVLWEWKPDCSGLKSEWEVRKRRQQRWTPLGRSLDSRQRRELHPSQRPPSLLKKHGKEDWGNLEAESDIPWTLRMYQGSKLGIGQSLKLPSLKTKPTDLLPHTHSKSSPP